MNGLLVNLINLALCAVWGWAAMCRLAAIHERVLLRVQLLYLGLFVASVFCGLQYFIVGTLAGWPDVVTSLGLCALMWTSVSQWRGGPPATVCRC